MYDYDLIVIGAGAGGLTAAIGGAGIGAKVLLIEGEKLGGDCTHFGCVPSKALIKAAHVARAMRQCASYGLESKDGACRHNFHLEKVLQHVKGTVDTVEERFETVEAITKHGVDLRMGFARFVDPHTVMVGDEKITAKKFVIAAGARPAVPDIPGLADIDFKTNRTIFDPANFSSLIVVGTGPIGCELAQAFVHLGVKVTVIGRDTHILSREDTEAADMVQKQFATDGVTTLLSQDITAAFAEGNQKGLVLMDRNTQKERRIVADELLIAIGRQPNVEHLGLEDIGIAFDPRKGIMVDQRTRTNIPHIYAVGDIATPWKFTHYANHMGKVALTNALLRFPAKTDETVIPRATFVTPEVASVGIAAHEIAAEDKHNFLILKKEYDHVDRAITDSDENGFFKIIVDKKGFIHGATFVGEGAGELINEIALAMRTKLKITQLADTIHAYPTYAYGLRTCADQFRQKGYTKGKRDFVKKVFGLRGSN